MNCEGKMHKNKDFLNKFLAEKILVLMLLGIVCLSFASAQQTGASLTNVSTSQKTASPADWGNHSKGAIHTIRLQAEQQNYKWKAYVGNVSSNFVLDDAEGYSIYQWSINSFTGQIYITRQASVTWGSVSAVSEANKLAEDTRIGHTSSSEDSVNRTFSNRIHRAFTVGSIPITENSSYSTVTWQNDLNHQLNVSAPFQEVLLTDGNQIIYTVFVENDKVGYRADGTTYDFQAIVPENATTGSSALTYYFFLELSS